MVIVNKAQSDTLRGLACVLLVSYHAGSSLLGPRMALDHPIPSFNELFAVLRMPLFALLSGYVYAHRPYRGELGVFLRSKWRRLIVPMLIVGTGYALLEARVLGTQINWWTLHIVPVYQFWFLESMFIIFLLVALLERLKLLADPTHFLLVLVFVGGFYLTADLPHHLGLQGVAFLLPFFLLGLGCHRFSGLLRHDLLYLLLAVLLTGMYLYFLVGGHALPGRHTPAALVMGVCSSMLLLRSGLRSAALAWIGKYSFAIFLFHIITTGAARLAFKHLQVTDLWALYAASMVAGLFGSSALARILAHVPYGHLVLGEKPPKRTVTEGELEYSLRRREL